MKIIQKAIASILVVLMILYMMMPFSVFALTQTEISSYLKDGSSDVDFNYEFNIADTFDVIYSNTNIEEYIQEYIWSKIGNNYAVSIHISNINTYKISENETEIYQGTFSYSLQNKLELSLDDNNDEIESIKEYIIHNTNYQNNIDIVKLDTNYYTIKINDISSNFEITFTDNNSNTDTEDLNHNIQSYAEEKTTTMTATTDVVYQTHVQNISWQDEVSNGQMSGTTGQSLRLEGIKISLANQEYSGNIEYQTHIQNIGWETSWSKNGELSGTTGKSLRLEAIKIRLTGEMAEIYDIYYRVHSQAFGWLDWAKNGEAAGTSGYSYRLEAIQIVLVKKGEASPGTTTTPYIRRYVSYQTHIQGIGWQNVVYDGNLSGTTGRNLRLEGIKIAIPNQEYSGNIEYQTHIQNIGWETSWSKNGELSGTTGKSLRLEAIKIRLTGEMAENYDIYYRVYSQAFGWLDWAKNGEAAGTSGYSYRLEAIQIVLVEKGETSPGATTTPYIQKFISYQAHNSSIGWQESTQDGLIAGTIGKNLEAYNIKLIQSDYSGSINYSSYVNGIGWQNYVSNGNISGTTGQSKNIEAIKINLSGKIEEVYDIYYSVYVSNIGWLDWAKNDQVSGNIGYGNSIQAMKIKLVEKNSSSPGATENIYSEDDLKVNYTGYVQSSGWQDYVSNGDISGTTGQSKRLEGIKIELNKKIITGSITYSTHVSNIGWTSYVSDGAQSGSIGRKIEAIKIKLTGDIAEYYDVYYRVHVSNIGWMGWTSNDSAAGTTGAGRSVEAIQIILVEKGSEAPSSLDSATTSSFLEAYWTTDSSGNRYYYDIYGNLVTSGGYAIGDTTYYFGPTGIYLGNNNLKVIDVSAHQGYIDWGQVASSGIYGVILRIAAGCEAEDSRLAYNIAQVKKYNIPYGIYIYSYAENYAEGVLYANFTKNVISKYSMNPTLGIYLDLESNIITSYMGISEYTNVVQGFLSVMPNAKIYTYLDYANTALNTTYIRSYITWIAHYNTSCGYTGSYNMWQYTSTGSIAGISGNVDMSILYT